MSEYVWYCPEQDEFVTLGMDLGRAVMESGAWDNKPDWLEKIVVQSKDFKNGYMIHKRNVTLHFVGEL